MSIKTQIKKELKALERYELKHRTALERLSTLALTAVTLFSLCGLEHESQKVLRQTALTPAAAFNPAEKNETVRMPIKFDDGLRAIANTGQ